MGLPGRNGRVLQITGFPHRYMYLLFDLELGRAQFIDYVFWRIRVGLYIINYNSTVVQSDKPGFGRVQRLDTSLMQFKVGICMILIRHYNFIMPNTKLIINCPFSYTYVGIYLLMLLPILSKYPEAKR